MSVPVCTAFRVGGVAVSAALLRARLGVNLLGSVRLGSTS